MAEAHRYEEQMEGPRAERRALTTDASRGRGLRAHESWVEDAGSVQSPVRYRKMLPLSDDTGVVGGAGLHQGYPRTDQVRALGHRVPQRASSPCQQAAGEIQSHRRDHVQPPQSWHQSYPPKQRRASWQSTSLVQLPSVTAGSAATTVVEPHQRDASTMAPSSPFTAFEAETFASRYADNGGGSSMVSRSGYMSDCRSNHTMGSPSHSRWASYPGAGSSIDGVTDRGGGERTRDRDHSGAEQGEERGGPGTPASNWVMQSANELPHCQHPSRSTPTTTGAEHARDRLRGDGGGFVVGFAEPHAARSSVMGRGYRPGKTSWTVSPLSSAGGRERYRRGDSLPSTSSEQPQRGAEYGRAASRSPIEEEGASLIGAPVSILGLRDRRWHQSHSPSSPVAAEVAALMTAQGSPPSWDFGSSRRSGVKARLTQARDGLPSVGQGGRRWSPDTDGRSSDPGAYTGSSFDQELGHDERLRRGSPVWDQHYYRHHTGCLGQDHASQLTSTFPSASAATTVALHWQGRGGSDADMSSTGGRDGAADSVRLPDRVPGLAEASPTVGNQAGGRSSFRLGEQRDGSSRYAGSGVGGGDGGGGGGDRAAGAARMEGGGAKLLRSRPPALSSRQTMCMDEGCEKRARFAYKNQAKPAYCVTHRLGGMIDTRHPRCRFEQCIKQPSFGMEGDRRASYCAKHKRAGMINVTSRRCQQIGCLRNPNFGFQGDKRATRCKAHSEKGMVDVVSRRCLEDSCMRRPLYNLSGLLPAYCRQHKLPEMIDVISARCQEPGCLRHPSFGYASDMKARRCARHRLENMEGVKGCRQRLKRLSPPDLPLRLPPLRPPPPPPRMS